MLEQLKELLEMQRVLDENILKEKGITEYPLENMKIALFVELGELMNEFPTKFKHWKSTAVDNREKGLEEYVDCLHFALSLANCYRYDVEYFEEYQQLSDCSAYSYFELLHSIIEEYDWCKFVRLFGLGNKLGFTWQEIYEAYKKKNAINWDRLHGGY